MTNATLTVNGSVTDITAGADFKETAINAARDAGFGKFRVILNGEEIDPATAPATLEAGMGLEIRPYEVAGR